MQLFYGVTAKLQACDAYRPPPCHLPRVRPYRPDVDVAAPAFRPGTHEALELADMDDRRVVGQAKLVERERLGAAAMEPAAVDHDPGDAVPLV